MEGHLIVYSSRRIVEVYSQLFVRLALLLFISLFFMLCQDTTVAMVRFLLEYR